jgi:uncharacterized Fe-S cluster-containing protein
MDFGKSGDKISEFPLICSGFFENNLIKNSLDHVGNSLHDVEEKCQLKKRHCIR